MKVSFLFKHHCFSEGWELGHGSSTTEAQTRFIEPLMLKTLVFIENIFHLYPPLVPVIPFL